MMHLILIPLLALGAAEIIETAPGEVVKTYAAGGSATEGDTVVLVPGLTGCAYGYRHVASDLEAQGFRVLVVEPLGIGEAGRPRDADYSLTAQADRLAQAIDRHRAGPCIVVAHGVAGSMALRLAYRRPDLVRAVVSIEGGPDESSVTPTVTRALGFAKVAAKLGAKKLIRDKVQSSLEKASGDRSWIDRRTVGRYFQGPGRDLGAAMDALKAMAQAEEPESLRDNLPRIACPVVLLLGTADHSGRPDEASVAALRAGLPELRIRNVPGAGHFIFEEQPLAVVSAVLDLFRGPATEPVLAAGEGEPSCVP